MTPPWAAIEQPTPGTSGNPGQALHRSGEEALQMLKTRGYLLELATHLASVTGLHLEPVHSGVLCYDA